MNRDRKITSGVFRGHSAMPPRVAHPNFYDKSTGTVHGGRVQGLLLQAYLLTQCINTPFAFKKNFSGGTRVPTPDPTSKGVGAGGGIPSPPNYWLLSKILNTPLKISMIASCSVKIISRRVCQCYFE